MSGQFADEDDQEPPSELSTTTNDKVSALLQLANYAWKNFDGRRSQQWKTNFTLWTALAAITGLTSWQQINISYQFAVYVWIFLGILFGVYWLPWTTGMWRRNFDDTQNAAETLRRVRSLIEEPIRRQNISRSKFQPHGNWLDYLRVWGDWSRCTELTFTLLFMLIAAVAVGHRLPPSQSTSAQAAPTPGFTPQNVPAPITPAPPIQSAPAPAPATRP